VPATRPRSWYGWGFVDEALDDDLVDGLATLVAQRFGRDLRRVPPPTPDEVVLRPPRLAPPTPLAHVADRDPLSRAAHTYGKAFRDIARAFERRWEHPPDVVLRPTTEQDVVDVLDWAADVGAAVIPVGGGSSVVGGVEPDLTGTADPDRPTVSLDLTGLAGVVEVDATSRSALVRAGTYGPDADAALREHDLSMRHFPQSYEHSTVGGWLATRSGGHFATGPTHIDDLVESIRAVTPTGVWESRRLPASGAGPSPDRMLLGSEGTLGIITQAWLRVHRRPTWRGSRSVRFAQLDDALAATRAIAQSGLMPSNARLLDPVESESAGVSDGSCVLLLGFESADHPVQTALDRAVAITQDHGGVAQSTAERTGDAAAEWRSAFLRAPYLRDAMVSLGVVAETFETACTWRDLPRLHRTVVERASQAIASICGTGQIGMRLTHVYPNGAAPYYTVLAPGRHGSLVAMWDEVKAAVSEAIIDAGGTITHHHAVGRDHMTGYRRQRPTAFARSLAAVKDELDPDGILNPGVLTTDAVRDEAISSALGPR
jgi:alkyldihydroxyacetonephosphate synthase